MTSGRVLAVPLDTWMAAVVALNVAAARLTANSMPRQIVRTIDAASDVTDLFVGNSLMAAGIDQSALQSARPDVRPLNIGIGSTTPIEHDLLTRRALRLHPRRVYYGFFDAQLTQPIANGWSDLSGNRAMIHYVDREAAIRFIAPDDPIRAWRIRLTARIPLLVERVTFWADIERVRRAVSGFGMPLVETNRFGRASDFALLERDEASFRAEIAPIGRAGVSLLPAVADLFDRVRGSGAALIVVEMPMPGSHRTRFYDTEEWRTYRDAVRRTVARLGGEYVDASSWIDEGGFEDVFHVNATGARAFSTRLIASVVH